MTAVAAIDADNEAHADQGLRGLPPVNDHPWRQPAAALAHSPQSTTPSRIRPIPRHRRLSGAWSQRGISRAGTDYTGGISKCGDRRVRTLLYEAANVMLTRYKGQLKLKDWAFAIAKRSTMRKARVALARRLAIIMHAMLRDGTEFAFA